jgi:hypothetical protein
MNRVRKVKALEKKRYQKKFSRPPRSKEKNRSRSLKVFKSGKMVWNRSDY